MPPLLVEDLSFLIFIVLMGFVFVGSSILLIRQKDKSKLHHRYTKSESIFLCAGAVGLGCVIYGLAEPFSLELTRAEMQSNKLASNSPRIRIIQISDMHCDGVQRIQEKLLETIRNEHPDAILFTGDAVNNRAGLPVFRSFMKNISAIAPVFAVRGNNDLNTKQVGNVFEGTGVQLLNGNPRILSIGATKVWIAGVDVTGESAIEATLSRAPKDAFTIFLYHYPSGVKSAAAHGIDLFCAGHTHGGQVRLPLYGAIVTNSVLEKKYEAGEYHLGSTMMYVNRGIGMIGIPVRFLCPPEVAEFNVYPLKSGSRSAP
jgi:predicted MPP superfamily phosphohydrolase